MTDKSAVTDMQRADSTLGFDNKAETIPGRRQGNIQTAIAGKVIFFHNFAVVDDLQKCFFNSRNCRCNKNGKRIFAK